MAPGASADTRFMRQALGLARRAAGQTSPNPLVGAVVVRRGRVVGAGFHRRAGAPHAEVEALRRAGRHAQGATLYVTLEPCNHTGRTGPCTEAILASGIARVVAGARDPNPITSGRGLARLRRAGVAVHSGVLARDAASLNEPFAMAMTVRRPLVVAKIAQSLDGKIATADGHSRWISSPAARRFAHAVRAQVDAVLVGVETVLHDDPRLTARGVRHRRDRPVRVIVDSRLRTPASARCLRPPRRSQAAGRGAGPPTLIATVSRTGSRRRALQQRGVELLTFSPRGGRVPLRPLCRALARRGIQSVMMEGGGELLASAFAERLVDRVVWFIAPRFLGGRGAPSSIGGPGLGTLRASPRIADLAVHRVGPDLCVEGRVVYPRTADRGQRTGDRPRRGRRRTERLSRR